MVNKGKNKSQQGFEDGNETAVDPGEPPAVAPEGQELSKDDQEALDTYKEETGDPSGTAKNSAEAGIIAAAEAQIPGVVVPNTNAAVAAKRAQEQARQLDGAKPEKAKPRPNARLKALKYPMTDPLNGVKVPLEGTASKVEVTNWMQAQVEAGLVAVIED